MPIPPLKKVLGENPDKEDATGLKRRKSNIHGPDNDPHVTGQNRRSSHIHGPDHDQHNPKDAGLKRRQSHVKGPGHEQDATGLKRRQSHIHGSGHDQGLKRRPTHGPTTGPPQKHGKKILQKKMQPGKLASEETKKIIDGKTEEKDTPTAGNEPLKVSGPRPANLFSRPGQAGKDKGWAVLGSALKNRNRRDSALYTTAKELAELGGDGFFEIWRNFLRQKMIILFIPCLAAGIVMFIKLEELGKIVGIPPTEYAFESYNKCWTANALFIGIVVYGFIILALRVSSIANGILYLFIVTVVFNLAINSASRCYYFYAYDNFESVLRYIQKTNKVLQQEKANAEPLKALFLFFDHIQTKHECCGWDDVDILQSWPVLLSHQDTDDKKSKKYYIRTSCRRVKTGNNEAVEEVKLRSVTGDTKEKDIAEISDITKFPTGTFMDIKTTAEVLSRQDLYFGPITKGDPPLPQLDANGLAFNTSKKVKELTAPYLQILDYYTQIKLNLNKISGKSGDVIHWDVTTTKGVSDATKTKQIYTSRGIYKNVKDKEDFEKKFWTKSCEKISDPEKELEKKPKIGDFPLRGEAIYKYQTFIVDRSREHVFYYAIFSSAMILMICLLTFIFWHYYALLKAEELTDLGYPPDFDLLDLHLQGYEDEESTKKHKEKLKSKKLANKKKGNFQKEMVATLRNKLKLARNALARKRAHAARYHNAHHLAGHHPHDPHHPEGLHPHDAHHPDFHHPTGETPHAHEDHVPPASHQTQEAHTNPQAAGPHKLPAETLKPPATLKKTEAHNLHPVAHKKTEARNFPPAKKTGEHKPHQFPGPRKDTDKALKPPDAKKKL